MSESAAAAPAVADDGPVTLVVRRRVRPGREADYEAWLARLQAVARDAPGYLGVTTQRPAPGGPLEYTSVIRFASLAAWQAYTRGEAYARALDEVAPLADGDAVWEQLTGLEFWFAPPAGTAVPQPSRPRMALLLIVVVFVLVLVVGRLVDALAGLLPFAVPQPMRLLLTVVLQVALMTWWLMPLLTRRLARWIYPASRRAGG